MRILPARLLQNKSFIILLVLVSVTGCSFFTKVKSFFVGNPNDSLEPRSSLEQRWDTEVRGYPPNWQAELDLGGRRKPQQNPGANYGFQAAPPGNARYLPEPNGAQMNYMQSQPTYPINPGAMGGGMPPMGPMGGMPGDDMGMGGMPPMPMGMPGDDMDMGGMPPMGGGMPPMGPGSYNMPNPSMDRYIHQPGGKNDPLAPDGPMDLYPTDQMGFGGSYAPIMRGIPQIDRGVSPVADYGSKQSSEDMLYAPRGYIPPSDMADGNPGNPNPGPGYDPYTQPITPSAAFHPNYPPLSAGSAGGSVATQMQSGQYRPQSSYGTASQMKRKTLEEQGIDPITGEPMNSPYGAYPGSMPQGAYPGSMPQGAYGGYGFGQSGGDPLADEDASAFPRPRHKYVRVFEPMAAEYRLEGNTIVAVPDAESANPPQVSAEETNIVQPAELRSPVENLPLQVQKAPDMEVEVQAMEPSAPPVQPTPKKTKTAKHTQTYRVPRDSGGMFVIGNATPQTVTPLSPIPVAPDSQTLPEAASSLEEASAQADAFLEANKNGPAPTALAAESSVDADAIAVTGQDTNPTFDRSSVLRKIEKVEVSGVLPAGHKGSVAADSLILKDAKKLERPEPITSTDVAKVETPTVPVEAPVADAVVATATPVAETPAVAQANDMPVAQAVVATPVPQAAEVQEPATPKRPLFAYRKPASKKMEAIVAEPATTPVIAQATTTEPLLEKADAALANTAPSTQKVAAQEAPTPRTPTYSPLFSSRTFNNESFRVSEQHDPESGETKISISEKHPLPPVNTKQSVVANKAETTSESEAEVAVITPASAEEKTLARPASISALSAFATSPSPSAETASAITKAEPSPAETPIETMATASKASSAPEIKTVATPVFTTAKPVPAYASVKPTTEEEKSVAAIAPEPIVKPEEISKPQEAVAANTPAEEMPVSTVVEPASAELVAEEEPVSGDVLPPPPVVKVAAPTRSHNPFQPVLHSSGSTIYNGVLPNSRYAGRRRAQRLSE